MREDMADGATVPEIHRPRPHPWHEFAEPLRETREKRRSPHGARKRCAVLTMVHNESVFLPLWLRYYSRFFAPGDIYVLDNESNDGSTARLGFVRIPVAHSEVDHTWMVRTIEAHQHELLERYDVVLTTDVDEIVAPHPEWGTLREYVDRFEEEFVNCLGYEILHLTDREGPFRMDQPILDQRHYWFTNGAYDKPALATTPMRWEPGFHAREDGEMVLDPDLYLIHLHRMDYRICLDRHREREGRSWNQRDLAAGWAAYNRITKADEFERWFYEDSSFEHEGVKIVLEPIPAAWRGVF
jgi:hypothetical protein